MTTQNTLNKLSLAAEALRYELSQEHSVAQEGRVSDMLASMYRSAKGIFSNLFKIKIEGVQMVNYKPVYSSDTNYKRLTPANFMDFSARQITAVSAFKGNYLEYGTLLDAQLQLQYASLDENIRLYTRELGAITTNKESRSAWTDFTPVFVKSAKERTEQVALVSPFFMGSRDVSTLKVGEAITRIADMHQLDTVAKSIQATMKSMNLKAIEDRIAVINDLANLLADDITAKRVTGISSANIANLSAGILELAYQVENFSLSYYRAAMFLPMVERLQEEVKSLI